MNCQICGKRATIHLTVVSPSGTAEAFFCVNHAGSAGLSEDQVQKIRKDESAMSAYVNFVESSRRIPSTDEMARIGVLEESQAPQDRERAHLLRRIAEENLATQDDSNNEGSGRQAK